MTPSEFFARHFSQIIFDLFPDSFYFKVLINEKLQGHGRSMAPPLHPPPPPVFKTDLGVNVSRAEYGSSSAVILILASVTLQKSFEYFLIRFERSFGITEPEIVPSSIHSTRMQ